MAKRSEFDKFFGETLGLDSFFNNLLDDDPPKKSTHNNASKSSSHSTTGYVDKYCKCGETVLAGAMYCHSCGRYFNNTNNTHSTTQIVANAIANVAVLPLSVTRAVYEDLTSSYCNDCGYEILKNWNAKYCPKCGKYLK